MNYRKSSIKIATLALAVSASLLPGHRLYAGEEEVTKLPELTTANIVTIVDEQIEKYRTKENVVPMLWQGFLEMEIKVDDTVRTAKVYVPADCPQGTPFILMNVPEGMDSVSFVKESGWKEIADQEEMPIFVLEPENGTSWGTPEEEMQYVIAACEAQKAGKWLNPGFCRYMVGYGEIGSTLQAFVMENPLTFAGAAFVDASQLSAEYLSITGDKSCDTETQPVGMTLKEVPTPVAIFDENMDEQALGTIAYWEQAANDENAVERYAAEGEEILKEAVISRQEACDYQDPATTEEIWAHIGRFYRYGNGWLSNSIYWRNDYEAMGVEFKCFTDSSGIDREYMVYVPEAYRGSEEPLPLLMMFHGAGNTMRQQFDNTLWYQLADKEGFIVVSAEASLVNLAPAENASSVAAPTPKWSYQRGEDGYTDAVYANELLDLLEQEYPVDPARIYANGHSMGCGMTLYLCQTSVGDRFAAVASTGGLPISFAPEAVQEPGTQAVPTFVFMGEYDLWSYVIDADENEALNANANKVLLKNGLATEETVDEVRKTGATRSYVEGRYNNSIWENEEGIPMFRYTWVEKLGHAVKPEEMEIGWYEWLSRYKLDPETGTRTFVSDAEGVE